MPSPHAGPILSHDPVRTIERDELRQALARGVKLVMSLGEWAFQALASVSAYHRLVEHGYSKVRRYAGGLEDWESAGLPLEGNLVHRA